MKKLKQHYLNGVDKVQLFYSDRRKKKVTLTVLVLVLILGLGTVGLIAMQKASVEPKTGVIEVVPKDDKDESDKDASDKDESDKDESDKDKSNEDEPDKDEPDKGEPDKSGDPPKAEAPDPPKAEAPDPPKAEAPDPPKAEAPKPQPPKTQPPKTQPPKTQPPAHTHTWVPQYKNHPAQAAQGYYDYVPPVVEKKQYVQFGDGHKIYSEPYPGYISEYAADHETNWWSGYETVTVKEGYEVWIETSPAKAAWSELTHYICEADGATKRP